MIAKIPNYDGYFISDDGVIYCNLGKGNRRDKCNKEVPLYSIKPRKARNGYLRVYMRNINTNKREDKYIHRLVAEAFIPNPNNYKYVNHKDTNRENNVVANLEWCTLKYNNEYTMKIGHMTRDEFGRFQSGIRKEDTTCTTPT